MTTPDDEQKTTLQEPTEFQTIGTFDSGETIIFDVEEPIERYQREMKRQTERTNQTYAELV